MYCAKSQHKKNTTGMCKTNWSTPYPAMSLGLNLNMLTRGNIQKGLMRLGSASDAL